MRVYWRWKRRPPDGMRSWQHAEMKPAEAVGLVKLYRIDDRTKRPESFSMVVSRAEIVTRTIPTRRRHDPD